MDALPLTPSGKVNRRALALREAAKPDSGAPFVAPSSPIEQALSTIWSELLGVGVVGVQDSFFDLGGHSLLATQVISRTRQIFDVEIPLREFFQTPTISGLAGCVEERMRRGARAELPIIKRTARDQSLPLSFSQQRLWFLNQLDPDSSVYNCPVAMRLAGPLDVAALAETLCLIINRHEILRTSFPLENGRPIQRIAPAVKLQLPLVDISAMGETERDREARRVVGEETQRPFDLAQGPLLRASLLRLEDQEHAALVTMHHIVSDGWSTGVLIREVAALYGSCCKHEPSPLPELPVQYADYACWQREWLQGEVVESQLDYWRKNLAGAPPMLELTTDKPRPAAQTYRGSKKTLTLDRSLTAGLKRLSRQESVTFFMTLLAVFKALLLRYTGQHDVVVGAPIAGRSRLETEALIGFFVNTIALRTDLSGDPTFVELLQRVKEVTMGAYAHQDVPFERVVEEVQPERDLSRSPLFQVMFVLQNAPREERALSGLEMSRFGIENNTAKFDLTLFIVETRDELVQTLEYNADLFEPETISRMLVHF
ncbi:MAG: non-ribosomal peptide synthetase, partial [Acidobacteria bacterium]